MENILKTSKLYTNFKLYVSVQLHGNNYIRCSRIVFIFYFLFLYIYIYIITHLNFTASYLHACMFGTAKCNLVNHKYNIEIAKGLMTEKEKHDFSCSTTIPTHEILSTRFGVSKQPVSRDTDD